MGKLNQTELVNENLDFYIPRALPVLQMAEFVTTDQMLAL